LHDVSMSGLSMIILGSEKINYDLPNTDYYEFKNGTLE